MEQAARPIGSGLVDLPDGRTVGWTAWGDPDGTPVVYQPHAGSSGERALEEDVAPFRDAGLRLVAIARAGLGRSSQHRGRRVNNDAEDMLRVVDALALESGLFLAACTGAGAGVALAAQWPDRVKGLVLSAAFAPLRAPGSRGYVDRNLNALRRAYRFRWMATFNARSVAAQFQRDPDAFLDAAWAKLPAADAHVLDNQARRDLTKAEYTELMADPNVYVDEWRANTGNWHIDWKRISSHVVILHGTLDTTAPVGMAKWFAARIRGSQLRIDSDRGHYLPPDHAICALKEMTELTPAHQFVEQTSLAAL